MLPRAMKIAIVLWAVLWTFYAVSACTDPKNPVPCTGYEQWPDPCAAVSRDSGIG